MKKLYWDLEETQVQDDSNESSNLESLMKEYLDCLTKINQLLRPEDGPVVQCRIHELTELLKGELMKQLFQLSGRIDMEEIQPVDLFRAFQTFINHHLYAAALRFLMKKMPPLFRSSRFPGLRN